MDTLAAETRAKTAAYGEFAHTPSELALHHLAVRKGIERTHNIFQPKKAHSTKTKSNCTIENQNNYFWLLFGALNLAINAPQLASKEKTGVFSASIMVRSIIHNGLA